MSFFAANSIAAGAIRVVDNGWELDTILEEKGL
jgi:hypothetical protein